METILTHPINSKREDINNDKQLRYIYKINTWQLNKLIRRESIQRLERIQITNRK